MKLSINTKSILSKTVLLLIILTVTLSCQETKKEKPEEQGFPVEVEILKTEERVKQIEYFGRISSKIINYSFLAPGRVKQIFVRKNEFVRKGKKLVQLETKGFNLALNAAKNQENQAEIVYLEADKYYRNLKNAFNVGGVSGSDVEKAKLDRGVKYKTWQQSKINIDAKNQDFNQAMLIAQTDGIVSKIVPKVGELLDAGSEAITIQGKGLFVEAALSQKDLDLITQGTQVAVEFDDQKIKGKVSYISMLPDPQTFRHTVKIDFSNTSLTTKPTTFQTVKIYFETETVKGIWVPLKYISNNGHDFVNLAENNRLRKKTVRVIDFSGDQARVSGLLENDKLITKGAASIEEGYRIEIVGQ